MPYEPHPNFDTPPDSTVLHKYMSFYKFSNLLSSSSLFFCRANRFSDPLEGCYPRRLYRMSVEDWNVVYKNAQGCDGSEHILARVTYERLRSSYEERNEVAICSFCSAEHEFESLWRLYSEINTGVCLKTTVGSLKNALQSHEKGVVHIGRVHYISDDELTWGKENILANLFWPFLRKVQEYRPENEVRAIVWEKSDYKNLGSVHFDSDHGKTISISLSALLGEIILSPASDKSFEQHVRKMLLMSDLGAVRVTKSTLWERPF